MYFIVFLGADSELVIREGLYSSGKLLQTLTNQTIHQNDTMPIEHITEQYVGFYIYLRAVLSSKSRLSIIYSAFSYKDCFPNADFYCLNHRCIPLQLSCDTFNHCGDNSDEPATCSHGKHNVPYEHDKCYNIAPEQILSHILIGKRPCLDFLNIF